MDFARHFDPAIGSDPPGNCLIGPYLPFGLARPGPDTDEHNTSGYRGDRPIARFSHTHVSGTGGGGRYGNIGVTPTAGGGGGPYAKADERAEAGYYAARLLPAGILAELTCTKSTGLHRYTFPEGAAGLIFDLGCAVRPRGGRPGEDRALSTGGWIEFLSDREWMGRADFRGGWGHSYPYSVHFFARSDMPVRARDPMPGGTQAGALEGPDLRVRLDFGDARKVELRVGISYASVAQARAAVEREAGDRDFDRIRSEARGEWDRALSRIRIAGAPEERLTLFYTSFARLLCMPSDLGAAGNPLWDSGARQFTDLYCLWDSVRNANSLLALVEPGFHADLLNSLLDIADRVGWFPDAWIQGHGAQVQGGSSADILFCESALKGLAGIDYAKALGYMRKNAEEESPDPRLFGRHLRPYRDLGYVDAAVKNCVSRHLEYAYQDWCAGALASRLGRGEAAARAFADSRRLWNLWREDIGFFAPRNADGTWAGPFDPAAHRPDSWNDPWFYEGDSWQWSFSAHGDFPGLVARCGGPEGFRERLDRCFALGQWHPKETILHVPWLYHYAGRPDLSSARVRACLDRHYRPERRGLDDNEDMGCQSAFCMGATLGLYPVMGQDLWLLAAPACAEAEIDLGAGGPTLRIEAPGAGPGNLYITGASLDGRPLDRAWLRHAEIARGGTLRLELGAEPGAWGRGAPPPGADALLADGHGAG